MSPHPPFVLEPQAWPWFWPWKHCNILNTLRSNNWKAGHKYVLIGNADESCQNLDIDSTFRLESVSMRQPATGLKQEIFHVKRKKSVLFRPSMWMFTWMAVACLNRNSLTRKAAPLHPVCPMQKKCDICTLAWIQKSCFASFLMMT